MSFSPFFSFANEEAVRAEGVEEQESCMELSRPELELELELELLEFELLEKVLAGLP